MINYVDAVCFSLLAIVTVTFITLKWRQCVTKRLPPGPTGWPIFGYLDFIFSQNPSKLFEQLQRKYGNIFGFYVGNKYCVNVSGYKSLKEVFNKKALLSRPPKYLRTSNHKNFSELDVEHWDIQRKFLVNSLKTLGVGRSRFEEIVQDELSRVIPKLEFYVGKPSCNIRPSISTSISNTIMQLICSRWFEEDHPVMKNFWEFQTMAAESFSNNMAFLYFPWLDWILGKLHPHYRAINSSLMKMNEFIRSEIESRKNIHDESSTHDYIDLYLNKMKEDPNSFTVENLIANCLLVLMGGSDTTRNTLEWLLLTMVKFPDIQEKVYAEIATVLGPEKQPTYVDKPSLPYTEATILESERWKTLVPLNALRWTTEDVIFQGYTIPKNTVVMNNLRYCHMDSNYWESPEDFVPERFLSNDKSRVVLRESFMPFSLGRRDCPGDKLASIEVFLYFSTIIQKFKFLPPEEGLCLEGDIRVNYQAKKPVLRVQFR